MKNLARNPWFWGGTALIVFAYFTAQGSAQETGAGVQNALTIVGIGVATGAVIYSLNK